MYDTSKPVAEGGLCFRARFGVEHDGKNLLAEGSYPKGSEIKDGYPEFTMAMLKKLGWDKDLTQISSLHEAPEEVHHYISYLEKELDTPISIISVGPDRKQTFFR